MGKKETKENRRNENMKQTSKQTNGQTRKERRRRFPGSFDRPDLQHGLR
jgi:hypothetical protein